MSKKPIRVFCVAKRATQPSTPTAQSADIEVLLSARTLCPFRKASNSAAFVIAASAASQPFCIRKGAKSAFFKCYRRPNLLNSAVENNLS